ncbi:hypothetical protein [Promicromonospora sukumoe]
MHRNILEARVISAVMRVLDGNRTEDDFIEVKSVWPEPKKYIRQFAGAANRAAGSDIVLIVGLDETRHRLTPAGDEDPESWWSQLQSGFDGGAAPDLVNNLTVEIPSGGSVVAFAFQTDGAPYVIKNPEGKGPDLEVPIRKATKTEWARRSDLIRMLARRVHTPNAVPLDSQLQVIWHDAQQSNLQGIGAQVEHIRMTVQLNMFIEHLAPEYAMLPHYSMRAELEVGGERYSMTVDEYRPSDKIRSLSPHGVEVRSDGLLLTGPGKAFVWCRCTLTRVSREKALEWQSATVRLTMPVTGNDAPVRIAFPFERSELLPERPHNHYETLAVFRLPRGA